MIARPDDLHPRRRRRRRRRKTPATTPAPRPVSLFQRVITYVHETEIDGTEVTNAMLLERFPGHGLSSLRNYRAAARRGVVRGNGKGLPCATEPQRRRIAGRIRAMRELKIRQGERPVPVAIPLVRLTYSDRRGGQDDYRH